MKKYIFLLLLALTSLTCFGYDAFACTFQGGDVRGSLENCFNSGVKVVTASDMTVSGGLKTKILGWVQTIGGLLGLIAVGAIVYGGLLFVISGGADEKVTKGKKVIKWAIIGLVGLVSASSIIAVIVNIMFAA